MSFRNVFTKKLADNKKRCPRCKEIKDITDFYKNKSTKSGVDGLCKICNTAHHREMSYKRLYGITKKEYEVLYENQNGNCSICKKHFDLLCVDHNHETGKVRSLLCNKCNYNLGVYKENIETFQSFIDYIKFHSD